MKNKILFLLIILVLPTHLCFAGVPQVFFSDMTDGPVSGWEKSSTKGAAVSIWGSNFGTTRGGSYVTVGGTKLTNDIDYAEWGATTNPITARGLERITFYLNSSMQIGATTISVTTAEGSSKTIPFYCRELGSNHIYFVKTTGNDSADGLSVANAWSSFGKARQTAIAGDTVYFKGGIWTKYDDGSSWANAILYFRTNDGVPNHNNGILNKSITFASYPGEVAQMCNGLNADNGNATHGVYRHGMMKKDNLEYWTLSKFKGYCWHYCFRWSNIDLTYDNNLRIVGWDATTTIPRTDINTPESFGGQIMLQNGDQDNFYIYGNYLHHAGKTNEDDPDGYKVQSIYMGGFNGQYNNINIAWNEFSHNNGNVQIYGHNSNDSIENIYIHDNLFNDNGTTGMVLSGGDGATEYSYVKNAWVYNNIFMKNLSYAIKVTDASTGSHGGTFYLYNNVFYDNTDSEIYSPNPAALFAKNNIFYTHNSVYFSHSPGSNANHFGANNCFYGAGNGPLWAANSINADPQFINDLPVTFNDFSLKETSPLISAGTNETLSIAPRDFHGFVRSSPPTIGTFNSSTYLTPSITIKSIKVQ